MGSESSQMTVALTGATGFVGRHVAGALVRAGHSVRALCRDQRAPRVLPTEGVKVILGDVFDDGPLQRVADGADAFINLIGIRRERPGGVTFERLHVGATRRCIEAARSAGADRYIQMSALGVRPEARSEYHKTKHRAELAVMDSGLDWTIFRPSIIHGPEGEFMQLAKGWVTGQAPPKFFLPYFTPFDGPFPRPPASVQPVHVEDLAAIFADSVTNNDAVGEIYALGGPDALTWPDLLRTIRDNVPGAKVSLEPQGLPEPFCLMNAKAAEALGLGSLLPFSASDVLMATEDNTCSNAKASAHFGYEPRSFEQSLGAYADQL